MPKPVYNSIPNSTTSVPPSVTSAGNVHPIRPDGNVPFSQLAMQFIFSNPAVSDTAIE